MYRLLYRMVLRRVPAEAAHLAAFALIRVFGSVARVPGAAWAAARLARARGGPPVGVNIGKSRAAPDADAAADYAASARAVAAVAGYVVVNVSSPNTPGLRDLQAANRLRPVLVAVRAA